MKVNLCGFEKWERGYRIAIVSVKNPNSAVCITLENGMDEEFIISRVKNAFATLAHGIEQENAA